MKRRTSYLRGMDELTKALQKVTQEEKDAKQGKLAKPRTKQETTAIHRRAKETEKAVERFIRKEEAYEKKVRNLSVGTY